MTNHIGKPLKKSFSNYKLNKPNLNKLNLNSESNEFEEINLNSLRTKEAIKLLGYSDDELTYIPFQEYINLNQEVKKLSKEIQKRRYDFSENFRQKKLQDVYYFKNKIDINKIPKISHYNLSNDNILNKENISSTFIIDSIQYYNYSKIKNENDFINTFENKLENEILKKENQNIIKRQNLKNEEMKKEKEIKEEIEKIDIQEKEFLKRMFEEEEEKERKNQNLNFYKKKQENFKLNELIEEEKEKEIKLKNKEIENNDKKYKEKVEKMNEKYQNKIREKALSLENKHINLQRELDKIRKNKIEKKKLKMKKRRELILRNMINLENIYEIIKKNYEIKQILEEKKLKRLKEKKIEEEKEKKEQAKKKEENIQNRLNKNNLIQRIKKENILNNINFKEKRINTILSEKSLEIRNKIEENNELNILKQNNVKRTRNIKSIEKENKLIELINKEIKNNIFEKQKQMLSEQHNNFNQSLSYRKEIYNNEIEKVFSSNKFNKTSFNKIKEMFPDNQKIKYLIHRFIQLKKEEENDLKNYEERINQLNNLLKQRKKKFIKNLDNNRKIIYRSMNSTEFKKTSENNDNDLYKNKNIISKKRNTISAKNIQIISNKNNFYTLSKSPDLKMNKIYYHKNSYYLNNCISGRNKDKNNLNNVIKKNVNEVIKPKKPFCLDKISDLNTNQNTTSSLKTNSHLPSNRSGNKIFYTNI